MQVTDDLYNWQAQNSLFTSPLQFRKELQENRCKLILGTNFTGLSEEMYCEHLKIAILLLFLYGARTLQCLWKVCVPTYR